MGAKNLLEDMKGHMVHKIAPTLNPTVRGNFQVRLIGMHHGHAEIELRVVDENKNPIQSFGSKVIKQGGTITLEGFENTITFLPRDMI